MDIVNHRYDEIMQQVPVVIAHGNESLVINTYTLNSKEESDLYYKLQRSGFSCLIGFKHITINVI